MVDAQKNDTLSIFLVDDDCLDHEWVNTLFKRIANIKYTLTWAQTFEEAKHALNERSFDIAFIDFAIGPHSGIDLLKAVGGREAKTPMIMLTGNSAYKNDIAAMNAGAYDYVNKAKLDAEQLERALRYVIETRRLENELKAARDNAQKANEAKSTFLSNMSHDLRTPLNAIVGFSELMLNSDSLQPDQREQTSLIHSSGQHLTSMISDLILLAQFEANDIRIRTEECDVSSIIPSTINATHYAARQRGISVAYEVTNVESVIHGDQAAIQRMLMNLVASACDLAEIGQQLTISMLAKTEGLLVEIVGPCEKLSEVPLMQMTDPLQVPSKDYAAESVYRVGLSLAIAYRYAQLHSAVLEVSPHTSGDMCFSVLFPSKQLNRYGRPPQ